MNTEFHSKDIVTFKEDVTLNLVIEHIKKSGLNSFSILDFTPISKGTIAVVETVVRGKFIKLYNISIGKVLLEEEPDFDKAKEIYIESILLEFADCRVSRMRDLGEEQQQSSN